MGRPAARLGDTTSHGTPLAPGPGAANVLIEGKPAWRVGADHHQCPLVSGGSPHVGGVVSLGSITVMINGHPAARMGDEVVEAGPPNSIVEGAGTVYIG